MIGSNYHQVREVNDKKLFARHNGSVLTPKTSLNRDTDSERKIMEDVLNK